MFECKRGSDYRVKYMGWLKSGNKKFKNLFIFHVQCHTVLLKRNNSILYKAYLGLELSVYMPKTVYE